MDYKLNELKALMRDCGLGGYSRLRKAKLIALLHPALPTRLAVPGDPLNRGPCEQRPPRPSRNPPPPPQAQAHSVRFRPDRPRQPELLRQLDERQPSSQEINIFEQQEMSKS